MRFDDFDGQSALIASLRKDFQSGRIVHAYLLTGPEGTGKRSLSALLMQTLFCTAEAKDKPCGACGPCIRFETGNHPDVHRLAGEKSIGVEAIRTLIASLSQRSFEGGAKAVCIERAEAMTPQAQNALLKTLEEPPGHTVFFLLAQSVSALLPTVLSRVRRVTMTPLAYADARRVLESRGVPADQAALLAALSDGCVGKALRLHGAPDWWALRDRVEEALAMAGRPSGVLNAVSLLRDDKDHAADVLDILSFTVRTALRAKLQTPDAWPGEGAALRLAKTLSEAELARLLETLAHVAWLLTRHVPWPQAIETFLLTLAEEMIA